MFFQSLASMWVVFEGLCQVVPDLFVDTTGLAFTYPIVKIFTSSQVMSYTHYPTISTDMLQRVRNRCTQFNNDVHISNSLFLSLAKQMLPYLLSFILVTTTFSASSMQSQAGVRILWWSMAHGLTTIFALSGVSHRVRFVGSPHM